MTKLEARRKLLITAGRHAHHGLAHRDQRRSFSKLCLEKTVGKWIAFSMKFLRIMGLSLLLLAMSFVPAHNIMASSNASMMMQTADGSPCPPEDCDAMAGCTMALASGFSSLACLMQEVATSDRFDVSSCDFDFAQVNSVAMFEGDGLRRPPKI